MSRHPAKVSWALGDGDFIGRRYSRSHRLSFAGGVEVAGTASPGIVPAPFSRQDAVDPEAAFTAALSACHMLWFLDHAARAGFLVTAYVDQAEGTLALDHEGALSMTRVVLRPAITFGGASLPTPEQLTELHTAAHADCFIARSVKTEIVIEAF